MKKEKKVRLQCTFDDCLFAQNYEMSNGRSAQCHPRREDHRYAVYRMSHSPITTVFSFIYFAYSFFSLLFFLCLSMGWRVTFIRSRCSWTLTVTVMWISVSSKTTYAINSADSCRRIWRIIFCVCTMTTWMGSSTLRSFIAWVCVRSGCSVDCWWNIVS